MVLFRVLPIARHGVTSVLRPQSLSSVQLFHIHQTSSRYTLTNTKRSWTRALSTTSNLKTPDPGPKESLREKRESTLATHFLAFRKNRQFRYMVLIAASATLTYYWYCYEQVPDEVGRGRLMLFSQDSIGRRCVVQYKRLREQYRDHLVGLDDERARRYHRILEEIIYANGLDRSTELGEGRWQVMVVETEQAGERPGAIDVKSEVLLGKKAIVSTETLSAFSDEELAHLLCHDIAHILLNHRRENASKVIFTPLIFALVFFSWKMMLGQVVLIIGADHWWFKGVRAKQEIEADRLGMRLAAKAGYRPAGARTVWKHLQNMTRRGEPIGAMSVRNMPERLEQMSQQQHKMERYEAGTM